MAVDRRSAPRPLQLVCGDLHNLGDLMLVLQNLSPTVLPDPGITRIRTWQALPGEIVRQAELAGGTLIDGRALLAYARQCRGSDMVIGGGQLVRDNVSLRSLAGLALAAVVIKRSGGSIATRGLGVSHIASAARRYLWRVVLRRCDTLNLRDRASMENVRKLLPQAAPRLTADMVLLPTSANRALGASQVERDTIILAPCIDPGEDRLLELERIEQLLTDAKDALPGCRIVVACHDPRPGMDLAAAREIAAFCGRLELSISAGYDLGELMRLYGRSQLVMTNRLHSMIFGLLAGSAIVLIEDGNPKLRDVADAFGVPKVRRGQDKAATVAAIEAALTFDRDHRMSSLRNFAKDAAGNLGENAPAALAAY